MRWLSLRSICRPELKFVNRMLPGHVPVQGNRGMVRRMIKKNFFSFPSRDGIHEIQAVSFLDDEKAPVAVVQLVHGMAEYIGRYEELALFLAGKGFLVVGSDHLGHGETARQMGDYGYFCENEPDVVLVRDVHRLKKIIQEKYPNIPYYILGHSMGSLVLRNYLYRYGTGIDGAVLCGTCNYGPLSLFLGRTLVNLAKLLGQNRKPCPFLNKVMMGNPNKHTEQRTANDWLCYNEAVVDAYEKDSQCGFALTANGYGAIVSLIQKANKMENLIRMPKDIPVLFISGKDDPVGNYGEAVQYVYDTFLPVLKGKNNSH